jgi:hypothetical protein
MRTLTIQRNQLEYVGLYSRPPFTLWGAGQVILEGLYDAFAGLYSGLGDFRIEGDAAQPADQAVTVTLPHQSVFRFKFDRIEATHFDFRADDVPFLADVLTRGRGWLNSGDLRVPFQSHLLTYTAHASSDGTSKDLLSGIGFQTIAALGENLGTGALFHGNIPELGWRVQLTVDHSLSVTDGVFIQFLVLIMEDQLNYDEAVRSGQRILSNALEEIGFQLD